MEEGGWGETTGKEEGGWGEMTGKEEDGWVETTGKEEDGWAEKTGNGGEWLGGEDMEWRRVVGRRGRRQRLRRVVGGR